MAGIGSAMAFGLRAWMVPMEITLDQIQAWIRNCNTYELTEMATRMVKELADRIEEMERVNDGS